MQRKDGEASLLQRMKKSKLSYAMAAPYMILFIVFTVLPVVISICLSFTYYNLLESPSFVFISNYRKLFVFDDVFLIALKNTLLLAIVTGPVSYFACFFLAWAINNFGRGVRAILTTVFYAPSISGAAYMIWSLMFSSDSYGLVNVTLTQMGIINAPIQWLENPHYVLGAIMIVAVWMSLGTSFLAFIAGLQGVDRSLYEAGAVDGITNRFQELWYITMPQMRPQLMFGAVIQITASFGIGDITSALAGFPSVDYAAHTVVNHIVDYGTVRFEMGYASAIATVLFILMLGSNQLIQKLLRKVGS